MSAPAGPDGAPAGPAAFTADDESITRADAAPLMSEEVSWALSVYRRKADGSMEHHRATGKAPLHAIGAAHQRLAELGTVDDGPGSLPSRT